MKKINEVISKYKSIFNQEKEYLEILQECHIQMKFFQDIQFTLFDFKNDEDYQKNLSLIESFRKYSTLDDYLLGISDYSLILLEETDNFVQKITYHDIMESLDLFNQNFEFTKSFYIQKEINKLSSKLDYMKILTVNDIFNHRNTSQFTLYFIESNNKYCFGVILDGYEYIFYLPFSSINFEKEDAPKTVIYGYLYLINEYLIKHHHEIKKEKVFTTIHKEYGLTYEEYLKKTSSKNKYVVFQHTLKPFLIEPEGLTYYPKETGLPSDSLGFYEEKEAYYYDLYNYFKKLQFDKQKAEDYVRKNWIVNYDIGRIYGIQYNFVGTKEELETYKEGIIQQKLSDIELNFYMYKKHGLIVYGEEEKKGILKEGYSSYIKEYLSSFGTSKKDFNTENDIRIDLDNSPIFRIGYVDSCLDKYSVNAFKHSNISLNDTKVFKYTKKSVQIHVHLEEFIYAYNEFKNENVLEMNYDWYFPYKQLKDYVENTVQCFCHIRLTSGVREEEFKVLKDVFFYEGKERKKILEQPDFIYDTKKYTISSRNPYYFQVPLVLSLYMDVKEFEKIKKGIHPTFKSELSEKVYQEENLKLLTSERFLSKREILKSEDYDVVYTFNTHQSLNLYKGIKGKVIDIDNGVVIQDELGNIHKESFRSVGKSGWKHLSTLNYEVLLDKLNLSEKAFLQNQRTKLITKH